MAVSIKPLSAKIGAEASGADFSHPVPPADLANIKQGLLQHLVMVIRNQSLNPEQLLAAVRLFGETMEQHLTDTLMRKHPEIAVLDSSKMPPDKQNRVIPFGARTWHTDHTNHERPPKYTALYAVNLPTFGGDTSFANMHSAYASLPKGEQSYLRQLQTVNKIEDFGYISEEAQIKFGSLPIHPLIRTHPETGKRAIYVHPGKLERIVGQKTDESQNFIRDLLERVITPENTYRHHWQLGDLLICDNRAVLHKAHKDYDMSEGRIMHRIILQGDRPA